jgi:carbamoyl-phosphate synthase large subunit
LEKNGILKKYNVELIGASIEAIKKAEDRALFQKAMEKIGLETPKNALIHNLEEAKLALKKTGLPAIIRPSFTMGGAGGGVAYTEDEYYKIVEYGLSISPNHEVLIDESIIGWKEYEMEVVRDKNDNAIIVCSIENIDPMGVHTGDSITVAPALTLTDKEYQNMRNASIAVLREIGVETGGSNVQFAVNPKNGKMTVIEMNPRVSRSSALASKATGFPIAKVAAKLAVGYNLNEIKNDITGGVIPASFEPTIDYVVTKIPKFTFEKFKGSDHVLSSSMKSVGEVMAIGRSFIESFQKALRSLEGNLSGIDDIFIDIDDKKSRQDFIKQKLKIASPNRILMIAQALREDISIAEINEICCYDPWFIEQIYNAIKVENSIKSHGIPNNYDDFYAIKKMGFSDKRIAKLANISENEVRKKRHDLNIHPVYKRVDSCSAEFDSITPYMYSTYE